MVCEPLQVVLAGELAANCRASLADALSDFDGKRSIAAACVSEDGIRLGAWRNDCPRKTGSGGADESGAKGETGGKGRRDVGLLGL